MRDIKRIYIFLFIISIATIFLIFNNIQSKNIPWFSDNARDYLVAKNIIKHHDFKYIAPFAEFQENTLANSVFYYYFLSIFYLFSFDNEKIYLLLYMVFYASTIFIFSYLLGRIFLEKKTFFHISNSDLFYPYYLCSRQVYFSA